MHSMPVALPASWSLLADVDDHNSVWACGVVTQCTDPASQPSNMLFSLSVSQSLCLSVLSPPPLTAYCVLLGGHTVVIVSLLA